MNVTDAIKNRRSIRKFSQKAIDREILFDLIDCARLAPYPMNLQPLKFAIITEPKKCDAIFACTKWAGYLKDGTPKSDERPTAYIVILGDRRIKSGNDFKTETGIAGSTITKAAMEYGIGSCWLGALNRDEISKILDLPDGFEIQDVIALGHPAQKSAPTDMIGADVKYYIENGEMRVPKRSLDEVIFMEDK